MIADRDVVSVAKVHKEVIPLFAAEELAPIRQQAQQRYSAFAFSISLLFFCSTPLLLLSSYSAMAQLLEMSAGSSSVEIVSIASSPSMGDGEDDPQEPIELSATPISQSAEHFSDSSTEPTSLEDLLSPKKVELTRQQESPPDRKAAFLEGELPTLEDLEIQEEYLASDSPIISGVEATSREESPASKLPRADDSEKSQQEPAIRPRSSVASMAFSSAAATGVQTDALPSASSQPVPKYPPDLLAKKIEGLVLLKIQIDAEGKVTACEIQQSSGYPAMDESALEAVLAWKFQPALLLGSPVSCVVLKKLRFKIVETEVTPVSAPISR